MKEYRIVRVSTSSPVDGIGKAVAKNIDDGENIALSAIGAGSLNQLIKGIIKANEILAGKGKRVKCLFGYENTMIDGKEYSSIICKLFLD